MPREPENPEAMRIAAALTCMGITQEEIAARLNVGQSTVSKMLTKAEKGEHPLIVRQPQWLGSPEEFRRLVYGTPLDELNEMLAVAAEGERLAANDHALWPGYPHRPPAIYPYYSSLSAGASHNTAGWCHALRDWANGGVAAAVHRLVTGGLAKTDQRTDSPDPTVPRLVGVGWGRHIRAVCAAMAALREKRPDPPIDFIPLMGARNQMVCEKDDPVYTNPYQMSSNELAFDFHRAVNGDVSAEDALARHLPGTNFIPFDEPLDRDDEATGTLFPFDTILSDAELAEEREYLDTLRRRLFGAFAAYRNTFGLPGQPLKPPGPLCLRLDAVIAAVGDARASLLFDTTSRYGGVPQRWFLDNTIGDIASVLLLRDEPAKPAGRKEAAKAEVRRKKVLQQFERFQARWMGATEAHLRACADKARNARDGKGIGVVVLALGGSRAEVVYECLKRGLVNHLFADFALLDELAALVRRKAGGG